MDYFDKCEYLKNTFYYRLYQSAPDLQQQLNYGDCHDRYSGHTPCVYMKVAAEYGDGYAQRLAKIVVDEFLEIEAANSKVKPGILPEAAFEFLWFEPGVEEKSLEELPKVRYFKDLGLLCMRSGWKKTDKVFTIKCSNPGGNKQWKNAWKLFYEEGVDCLSLSHHHPDNLSYIFVDGSDYLTCEDGYNRNIMPDNHNVLLVDGKYTDACDVNDVYMKSAKLRLEKDAEFDVVNNYGGEVESFICDKDIVCYKADTHKIYPKELNMKRVSRTFFTDGLEFIVFADYFESSDAHKYSTISNTNMIANKVMPNTYEYALGNRKYQYSVFSEEELEDKCYEQTVIGVMTTQEPDKVCRSDIKTLSFASKNENKSQMIYECIVPNDANVKVEYKEGILSIIGKKIYEIKTEDASDKDMSITVKDNMQTKTYNL